MNLLVNMLRTHDPPPHFSFREHLFVIWLSSDNVQVAPQETEISSYLVGQIDSDLSDSDFDDFEL